MAEKTVQEQLEEIQLKTAVMNMKIAERALQQFEAKEEATSRQKAQRQSEFAGKVRSRATLAAKCKHKQGASPRNIYAGKGDTTLKKVRMMDGFTLLIHCGICRLAKFSPHPYDQNPEPQKDFRTGEMETATAARKRVAKWKADTAAFDKLLEAAEESKSAEYSETMDCGNVFEIRDDKGLQVLRRRPSDFYPQAAA